jgi:phosphotransferase system enzyme I (PtsP)
MFPMIADVAEFSAARHILDLELQRARRRGLRVPEQLKVGAMFGVPSLAWQLPQLLSQLDFLSVGSNDLRQFLFASDRGNVRLAGRYDVLSPAMLNLLDHVVKMCATMRVPVSVCGEMAGSPLEAMALVGLGFRTLSMAPPAVGPVRTMVRSLEVRPLRQLLDSALRYPVASLRGTLRAFSHDHGIAIES